MLLALIVFVKLWPFSFMQLNLEAETYIFFKKLIVLNFGFLGL